MVVGGGVFIRKMGGVTLMMISMKCWCVIYQITTLLTIPGKNRMFELMIMGVKLLHREISVSLKSHCSSHRFQRRSVMDIREYLESTVHQNEMNEMPISKEVIEVVSKTKPFQGTKIVLGHFMALNSVGLFEGLWRGGAEITICLPFLAKKRRKARRLRSDYLPSTGYPGSSSRTINSRSINRRQ